MLQGKLSAQGSLSGTLRGAAGLSGSLMGGGRVYPAYDGPTVFEPSEQAQTAETGGTTVLSDISIAAVPSDYVGSSIGRRASADLSASGATVTAPAGYYAAAASKSVASGTEGTPTASKSVSGHTATIVPSVTNTAGYIQGGTRTGASATVSASELVSGTKPVAANGVYDVTEYASVSVDVPPLPDGDELEYGTGLSDLTGTTWYFNATVALPSAESHYTVNFTSNNTDHTDLTMAAIGIVYDRVTYAYLFSSWQNQAYRTVAFTGGTDATNATLIAWVQANAVMQ